MSYSGNSSLSSDVQKRILDTFEQTLGLAEEGSRQEALLGCDFVLRMDPQFEPARHLQERLRASSGAVVDTDDLRRQIQGSAAPPPAADPFGNPDALDLDLPALPGDFRADVRPELEALLAQRRFPELMALAERERDTVMTDPSLMQLVEQAQSRMQAEPYMTKFAASARAALQAGQHEEAGKLIEKARALDPSHPVLAELEAARRPAPGLDLTPTEDVGFDLGLDTDLGTGLDTGFGAGFTPNLDPGFGAGPETSFGSLGIDFDEPSPAPAPAPAPVDPFASEPEPRIRELLTEGQKAFEAGDPQGAIDAWSRIFLIDIDHQEAARRIEMARKVRAEKERQLEEVFHEGVGCLENGDVEGAKRAFQRVLEIQPSYYQAREYLQQLEAGQMPVIAHKPAPARETLATPPPAEVLPGLDDIGSIGDLKEEILVPPDPGEMPAKAVERKARPAGAPAREGKARRLFVLVGAAVLLVVLGGGWYFYQNREQFFPNSVPEESLPPEPDPIARAMALQRAGKAGMAVSQLKRMLPSDPQYQRAQELIAQWEGGANASPSTDAPTAPAVPATISEERLALLASARQAHAEGSYLRAIELLEQANAKTRLDPPDAELLADAKRKAEPLSKQLAFFRDQEWEYVIPELWRMHEANPGDRDVRRLLVDSYYNLGLQDLQGTDPDKALEKFQEAMKLAPEDEMVRRQYVFAQTYQERPIDLLYRIYVKYLPFRS